MNNDAKPKWREYLLDTIPNENGFFTAESPIVDVVFTSRYVVVIEAEPALAKIESLRAENESLLATSSHYQEFHKKFYHENVSLETKLSAATAQIDKLVEVLKEASKYANMDDINGMAGLICDEALAQYQQFKKKVLSE